jgi:hypothetical protein
LRLDPGEHVRVEAERHLPALPAGMAGQAVIVARAMAIPEQDRGVLRVAENALLSYDQQTGTP